MGRNRLAGLALMYAEHISIRMNLDSVIDRFAKNKRKPILLYNQLYPFVLQL
jgi:hypothetical protein